MPIFEELVRTEARPRRQNESSFEYLNTSARPGICAIRDLLETWFDHLELLRSSGYEVEIHPSMADVATNPDFLARRYGVSQFYLEATLAMPPGDAAADRRLAALHDNFSVTPRPKLRSGSDLHLVRTWPVTDIYAHSQGTSIPCSTGR